MGSITQTILTIVHLVCSVTLVIMVLLQQGRGSDMGAAFGGGNSASVFGARGAANFLTRITSVLAVVLLVTSISLAYIFSGARDSSGDGSSVVDGLPAAVETLGEGDVPQLDGATLPSDDAAPALDTPESGEDASQ
ncbi:preprotein translocase subunit SecG [Gammaproteobacteria bacterium]|nr:preprotein translocase subunit SecG [Gammaproteobacteria bacterium]